METTLSTWRFDSDRPLTGCGVDVESATRFNGLAATDESVMPFVFSARELEHARRQPAPNRALCISFTCKEALRKALDRPYDFTECEAFPIADNKTAAWEGALHLSESTAVGGVHAVARSTVNPLVPDEWVTAVMLIAEEVP